MAARYDTRGLFAAIGAAALVMTLLVEFELHDAAVLSGSEATVDLASWLVALGIGGLLAWSLMLSLNAWLRTEHEGWEAACVLERAALEAAIAAAREEQAAGRWRDDGLTKREREVLNLLAQRELTYQQIGTRLCVSEATIKTHVRRIGEKLEANRRELIVAAARTRGLLPPDGDLRGGTTTTPPVTPNTREG
ncbi:MAG TPA: helix-turn-helix transcriptional regulator [Thermomicrobiaceae bacterium]|nr:helix-turn-helix transcriptional regulator [Thermomicrobiaceae bacterium]